MQESGPIPLIDSEGPNEVTRPVAFVRLPKPREQWFFNDRPQAAAMTARRVHVTVEHPASIAIDHDEAGDMHIHVTVL